MIIFFLGGLQTQPYNKVIIEIGEQINRKYDIQALVGVS